MSWSPRGNRFVGLYVGLFDLGITLSENATYGVLDFMAGESGGIVYASAATIGEKTRIGERQARRNIEKLESVGLIQMEPRPGTTPIIRLRPHPVFEQTPDIHVRTSTTGPPDIHDRDPGHPRPEPRTSMSDDNQETVSKTVSKTKRAARTKTPGPNLITFGENGTIKGTQEQRDKLDRDLGPDMAAIYLQKVDDWHQINSKTSKDAFARVRQWHRDDKAKGKLPQVTTNGTKLDKNDLGYLEWQRQREGGIDREGAPDLFRDAIDIRADADPDVDQRLVPGVG